MGWNIWEALLIPLLYISTPFMMNFCPRTLEELYQGQQSLDLPNQFPSSSPPSSGIKLNKLSKFQHLSIHTIFGCINLFIYILFASIISIYFYSLPKTIIITFGCLIHFSSVLLHDSPLKLDGVRNLIYVILANWSSKTQIWNITLLNTLIVSLFINCKQMLSKYHKHMIIFHNSLAKKGFMTILLR